MKRTPKAFLTAILIAALLSSCAPSTPVEPVGGSLSQSETSESSSSASLSQSESEASSESISEEAPDETSSEVSSEAAESSSESESSSSESSSASSSGESSSQSQNADPQKTPYAENGVTISQTAVRQGCFMKIRVENRDLSSFWYYDFYGRLREFYEYNGAWYSFIPIDPADEPGIYPLVLNFGDFTFEKNIEVIDRKFRTQYLEVKPSTLEETIEDDRVRGEYADFVKNYLTYESDTVLWEGKFMFPLGNAGYSETTKFGTFRTFSSGRTEWHNATDMAAAGGTPIYATNSGKIIFAEFVGVSGNTVIIDHGAGVLSWHFHLSELNCSYGDSVAKGDLIGKVGTTGLSTGNHLHFGISIGGVFTDPMQIAGKQIKLNF